ncbi:MAG: hypothetical protein FJW36_21415 [Acidobacteria bacterium]|nr:hypothetical protein [Acidobacteriota bacterium]
MLSLAASACFGATFINAGGTPLANHGLVTSVAGATTIDFSSGVFAAPTYTEDGMTYSGLAANSIQSSSVSGCAQPPNDTTNYLCVGPVSTSLVTATFANLLNYFGFYVGSVDTYNSIEFYNGNTKKFTLTGQEIATRAGIAANGNQSVGVYINIFADGTDKFDIVKFYSSSNSFESDNHAFSTDATVPTNNGAIPEPSTFLTIVPAAAYFFYRRKK